MSLPSKTAAVNAVHDGRRSSVVWPGNLDAGERSETSRARIQRELTRTLFVATAAQQFKHLGGFGLQYQRLREGAQLPRTQPVRQRSRRKNSLDTATAKRLAEEDAKRKALIYVPDDKWEEANTTVWFPVAPRKRCARAAAAR